MIYVFPCFIISSTFEKPVEPSVHMCSATNLTIQGLKCSSVHGHDTLLRIGLIPSN